ncbi:rRNA maturation RNase YbeY [Nitratireductor luteus]|uniref:rRNA maturation RNase YbeY n=1 Tax=Nitratireductor luteus TaxID=2976980 RepID=UPI00223F4656|nr:rRNA maturation RNase YbeY [Nitratireductor luteus]
MAENNTSQPIISVECVIEADGWPREESLRDLALGAIEAAVQEAGASRPIGLTVMFTDDESIRDLNARFRGKDKATNVLSFPAAAVPGSEDDSYIGDIAVARQTVAREAEAEGKTFDHHLTHLIIHGFLHLLGYDHETPEEAEEMETMERRVLEGLAISDPYA